jgi:DNA-binding transcriptional regulator YiaG
VNCIVENRQNISLDMLTQLTYIYIDMGEWSSDMIKRLRLKMGLTQAVFAESIGTTRTYVNLLEKGVKRPGKTLCILFDLLEEKENEKGKERS